MVADNLTVGATNVVHVPKLRQFSLVNWQSCGYLLRCLVLDVLRLQETLSSVVVRTVMVASLE